jgi:Tol biopolymer transport system component/tRNA A-37 threonylcarbamoyl transferase component Bud32
VTSPPVRLASALTDRYAIERELGQGGMATVYLAEDLKHRRKVAVKVLLPELAAAVGHERFLREITTTANLRHPHILPLYDSGEADGFLYYVMPYVEGESLRDRLDREKQLPLDDALSIAREVADALSYAHSRGFVHRDIKPENILLESGHAVVADFGIARAVSEAGATRLTGTGMAVGTPIYMSPEQAAGESDIDGRSDLYSLACVLYEMLAGQPPFTGATAADVVHQHLTAEARSVSQLRPAVPPAIADVLARALAKNPADRFSPAAHFAAALAAAPAATPPARRGLPSRAAVGIGVTGALAVIAALVLLMGRSANAPALAIGRTTQVTREPGLEVDPALSPDGATIAYAAGPTNAMQIYVREVSGGRPVALTNDTTDNFRWPRWSPDGSRIAYQSNDGIYVVPALGGAPRRVTRVDPGLLAFGVGSVTPISGFDWSPDGARIAWTSGYGDSVIRVVALAGGDAVALRASGAAFSPAWSPDGRRIAVAVGNPAFIFGTEYFGNVGGTSIWIVRLDGAGATRLTGDGALNVSPQWSPDGRDLFWVSDRDGSRDVYVQRLRDGATAVGAPRRLTTGADAQGLSVSRSGARMAYSRLNLWSAIWSIPVPARGSVSIRGARRITTGNETIEDADVSADGRWLVFDSDRGGSPNLYVMPAAGGEARQITADPAGDFSGDWSPDGRRIVFHSRRGGNRDIYTVEADGTGLHRWTSAPDEELDPDWAPDGETVIFQVYGSRHGFEILRLVEGARPEFFAAPTGDFAHWSPHGRTIVYHSADGLRLRDVGTGTDTLVVSNAMDRAEAYYAAWAPDGKQIYYLARSAAGWTIRSVPAAGGPSRVLVNFDDPTRRHTKYGFCTDGRVFYLTIGSPESDIYAADLERP